MQGSAFSKYTLKNKTSLQKVKIKIYSTLARSPDLIPWSSNSEMAGLLSRNIPAHLPTRLDGVAVVAGTAEVRDAQACPNQSILERSLSVTSYSVHLKIVKLQWCF